MVRDKLGVEEGAVYQARVEDGTLILETREALGIRTHEVTREDVALQAGIRALDRGGRLGSSLGDRLCLALAMRLGLPVLTADRAWAKVDVPIDISVIR